MGWIVEDLSWLPQLDFARRGTNCCLQRNKTSERGEKNDCYRFSLAFQLLVFSPEGLLTETNASQLYVTLGQWFLSRRAKKAVSLAKGTHLNLCAVCPGRTSNWPFQVTVGCNRTNQTFTQHPMWVVMTFALPYDLYWSSKYALYFFLSNFSDKYHFVFQQSNKCDE